MALSIFVHIIVTGMLLGTISNDITISCSRLLANLPKTFKFLP